MKYVCCICLKVLETNETVVDPEGDIVCSHCWELEKEDYVSEDEASEE